MSPRHKYPGLNLFIGSFFPLSQCYFKIPFRQQTSLKKLYTFYIENVAYNSLVEYSSTGSGNFPPTNAVDENDRTYVLTKIERNPQLTITLSKIFNIKSTYVVIYAGKTY